MSQSDSRPTEFVVPVVDISAYVGEGSTDERAAVAKAMDNACATVGFVQVVYIFQFLLSRNIHGTNHTKYGN